MPSPKKASVHTDRQFEIAPDVFVPLRIYQEIRNGYRATVGKKHLIFRLPHGLLPAKQQQYLNSLSDWARKTYKRQPEAFQQLLPREIPPQSVISVMGDEYQIIVTETNQRNSHYGVFDKDFDQHIFLELLAGTPPGAKTKAIQTLLSRLFSEKYLGQITREVHDLNDQHFRKPIKKVRLRLTQTRWGSCSTNGNINLSSRLLLAPPKVRQAVIVHELAHLIEMNHGDRFWSIVLNAMPDYKKHHAYLNQYGKGLQFIPE